MSRRNESHTVKNVTSMRAPKDLASLVRGLYRRVADRLRVDPSYVSRVARSERRSKSVEDALRRELSKILEHVKKQNVRLGQKAPGKTSAKKGLKMKVASKPT